MFIETSVPNRTPESELSADAEGKSASYELNRLLKRNLVSGCQYEVNMVWHKDEFMYRESILQPVLPYNIQQEFTEAIGLQKKPTLKCRE